MGRKKRTTPAAPVSGAGRPERPTADPALVPAAGSATRQWLRVGLILALALGLRVTALGWGMPSEEHAAFHPDEIAGLNTVRTLWQDPRHLETTHFASMKGIGFFYVGLGAMMLESKLGLLGSAQTTFLDRGRARRAFLTMRGLTVAFSVGTVLLVFLIGRRLFGPRVGELAALLEAVSPISVINAHYIKIDCAESFLVMLVLYFAARSLADRRFALAAVFTAGVAAAFKYPGGSAIIFPLAAALLSRADRARRLKLLAAAAPLFAVGFFLFFPSALLTGLSSMGGMKAAADTAFSGSPLSPLWFIIEYPYRLMQGVGVVLPAWALSAAGWALWRRRREGLLILAWLLPYFAVMSSSAVVLIRYSTPMMPAGALLMAAFVFDLAALKPAGRKTFVLRAGTAAAVALILVVTAVHLRTMLRPDPRELAARWIAAFVPPGQIVATTPSHNGDVFFTVSPNRSNHPPLNLYFRPETDVSRYPGHRFDWLAANEQAWRMNVVRHPSQKLFWLTVNDPRRWSLRARFSNRLAWPGIFLRGDLPEDCYYLYQETRVYQRRSD